MTTPGVTYEGAGSPDPQLLARLPRRLASILEQMNGCVAFRGGFHLRGSCREPRWHSLEEVWFGAFSLSAVYLDVLPTDIPFAQDCMADQWLLRDGQVWRLAAEYGGLEPLDVDLDEFFRRSQADPEEWLGLHPLRAFQAEGGVLEPGFVLHAAPPFCMKSDKPVSLRPYPIEEALRYLPDLALQLRDAPDGSAISLQVKK